MIARKLTMALAAAFVLAIPGMSLAETWTVPGDFATIQKAINSSDVVDGDEIEVGPGYFYGARITKSVTLRGSGRTYITNGPRPWRGRNLNAGFLFRGKKAENGSGAKIFDFIFQGVDFSVFASQWSAVVSNVTVQHCTMENAVQAITMWHADDWDVQYNKIVDLEAINGGGIGIVVGTYSGDDAFENLVANNEITGTVYVDPDDRGGYNAAGILLVSDNRGKRRGGLVEGNLVQHNRIALVSDTPGVVPVVGVELTDTRGWVRSSSVTDNEVTDNDLSGTADDVLLEPLKLDDVNTVQ